MKLGEMLVRDGRIEEADLERVILRQAQEGGRLGSLLVAEDLIDAETLTVYLGLELGIPIATGATFERCKRSAVRLLTPEMAARFRCIPIVIQSQTLIVAVDDPHDMQTLDEISQATGYRVIPRVAPEIRIHYYLERFYGIPKPAYFASMPDLRGSREVNEKHQTLPAPPLPGLPPRVATPLQAPMPAPPLRERRRSKPPAPSAETTSDAIPQPFDHIDTEEHEALELDAADLVEELEADDEALAEALPPRAKQVENVETPVPEIKGAPDPIACQAAIDIINETQKRGDIADAILGHAAELFEVATLLLVRDNMAFGWKGFGPGLDEDRIETLLMPLDDAPSMFKVALSAEDLSYRARPFPSTLHTHWFRVLRASAPNYSIVVVCSIGKRVVNLLYGQAPEGANLSDEQMDGLNTLMRAAGDAYVRLISKSKREHRAATMNPEFGVASAADPEVAS